MPDEQSYVLWLCDACGDNAEESPGSRCEACCEGTVQVVPVAPIVEVLMWAAQRMDVLALTASRERSWETLFKEFRTDLAYKLGEARVAADERRKGTP